MKSHSFSKDVWDLTEWSLLIGRKEWITWLQSESSLFPPRKRHHAVVSFRGKPRRQISSLISSHEPGKTPWHHGGGNHDTTEDSISSLILSQKPGKTPRHHGGGNHDTTGWKPRHHGVDTTTPRGGHHDTTKGSISSLILSHTPGKTAQDGNHDTTGWKPRHHDTTTPRRTAFSSLISSHKPGKTPRGGKPRHDEGQYF